MKETLPGAREQREAGTDCKVEQGKVRAVGEGLLGEGGRAEKGEQGKGGSREKEEAVVALAIKNKEVRAKGERVEG